MVESKQPWRLWVFVLGLNVFAFIGVLYLNSRGIDLLAFRGSS